MQKQIESLIGKIHDDTKMINRLLIEKKKIVNKLYTVLEIKRHGKIALEENQVAAFSRFMSNYENEKRSINEQFGQVYSKKGGDIERRNMLTYELLSKDLDSFNKWQVDLVQRLSSVVKEGEDILRIIDKR